VDQAVRNPDLHAAVLAAPDDDVPRLVYADWLMERGDPRGELIALQVERATLHAINPRAAALMGREKALMLTHYKSWQARLPQPCNFWYVRGFVEKINCGFRVLTSSSLEDACIRELQLHTDTGFARHIAPLFSDMALRTLDLRGNLEAADLAALQSPHLATVTTLRLVGGFLTAADIRAIHASSLHTVPALELENLHGAALAVLAKGPPLRQLRVHLGDLRGRIAASLRGPGLASVERLDLRQTNLAPEDVLAIIDAGLPLVELDLSWNRLDAACVARIATEPRLRTLERLGLANARVDTAAMKRLVASPFLSRQLELAIDGDALGMPRERDRRRLGTWRYPIPEPFASRFKITIVEGA
jgi:uncharacterized protein (TIGR02996 family)